MNEPTITAEDLTLYALQLLEGDEAAQVDVLLQNSTEAREELGRIRGDLAIFALGTEQQNPNPLTRQRLLKQVARERRSAPVALTAAEPVARPAVPVYVPDPASLAPRPDDAAVQRNQPWNRDIIERQPVPEKPSFEDARSLPPSGQNWRNAQAPDSYSEMDTQSVLSPRFETTFDAAAKSAPEALYEEQERGDRYEPSSAFAFSSFEQPSEETRRGGISNWFAWTGWATAAALAAAGAFAVRDNFSLRKQVALGVAATAQANESAARAQLVMQTLQSGSTQRFVLAKTDTAPVPSGRVAYLPERGTLIFQGSNLEPLAPYKTYELWLIPAGEGKQPVPAGTFKPDVRGYASIVLPQMPKGLVAGNFGVTVEDDGGASTPTLPILLIGQQS